MGGQYLSTTGGLGGGSPQQPHDSNNGPMGVTQATNNTSGGNGGGANGGDHGLQLSDWHSDNRDMPHRREMIQHITNILKQKDMDASPEWLIQRTKMVKELEVSLYRDAPSFDAYSDTTTLKCRLQLISMELAMKTLPAISR